MNKREFILELRDALDGEVSGQIIAVNVNYYENYIDEQIAAGVSEPEVLEMLGDPRLLARTIIDTNGGEGDYSPEQEVQYSHRYSDTQQMQEEQQDEPPNPGFWSYSRNVDTSKWYVRALAILIPVLIIAVVILIALWILRIVTWLAGPILIIIVCYMIYRYIRR